MDDPKKNACVAMKWEHVLSRNPNATIPTHASWWRENRPFKSTATTKLSPMLKEIRHPFSSVQKPTRRMKQCPFTDPTIYTTPFFDWLEELALDQDRDDQNVIVLFHNLKGYDGMFILQHCYATH